MGNQPLTTMATTYLSPGVYVEDVPPVARPIAGVGTSTAGFIGIIPDKIEYPSVPVKNALVGKGSKERKSFPLDNAYPVLTKAGTFEVRVNGEPSPDATLKNDDAKKTSSVEFTSPPKEDAEIRADYQQTFSLVAAGEVKLCTNFSEFTKFFGDFHEDNGQNMLAHAVYGFFNNGGSRCYVARESKADNIKTKSLVAFEAIDEIAIVAAPGCGKCPQRFGRPLQAIGRPVRHPRKPNNGSAGGPWEVRCRRTTPTRPSTFHGLKYLTRPQGRIFSYHPAAT